MVVSLGCTESTTEPPLDDDASAPLDDGSAHDAAMASDASVTDTGPHAPLAECSNVGDGYLALHTRLDVWWRSNGAGLDPGRDELSIYALVHYASTGSSEIEVELKLCGVTLPVFTSDVSCTAHELSVPSEAWDKPDMPTLRTTLALGEASSGLRPVSVELTRALLGIDLLDGREDDAWPAPTDVATVGCEAGSGASCFPDQDGDGKPGITMLVRDDEVEQPVPYDDGLCSNDVPYLSSAFPFMAWGAGGSLQEADELYVGLRTKVGGRSQLDPSCAGFDGETADLIAFDALVADCSLTPTDSEPRRACMGEELMVIRQMMPSFQVLASGETPGQTEPLLGWVMINRDIAKHPSGGTHTTIVAASTDAADGVPTCEDVRRSVLPP